MNRTRALMRLRDEVESFGREQFVRYVVESGDAVSLSSLLEVLEPGSPKAVDLITEISLLRYCRAEGPAIEAWRRRAATFLLAATIDEPRESEHLLN
jgi:hypothetical protein